MLVVAVRNVDENFEEILYTGNTFDQIRAIFPLEAFFAKALDTLATASPAC